MYDPDLTPNYPQQEVIPVAQPPSAAAQGTRIAAPTGFAGTLAELTLDPQWILVEDGFTLAREHEVESLFAISNGYVGNRGCLAEGSPLSAPATFVAGVFEVDSTPPGIPGFLVLPDWTGVRAWVEGQPLSIDQGQALSHRRVLDMRRGVLWREWRHRDPNGRITRVVSFRLASLADRHLLVHSVVFTPENYSGSIRLESRIELQPNVPSSPPPEEWKARRSASRPNVLPLALKSVGRDIVVAFGAASQVLCREHDTAHREVEIAERHITERFHLDVAIGGDYRLDRLIAIYTSREVADPSQEALAHVNRIFPTGVRKAVLEHENAWQSRWRAAEVKVEGDETLQKALSFAGYHLISAANPEDERVSIGARGLTGESYKGHVFWDTEIYMVPFYIFTHPPSARALLMYRYHTLPQAREKARESGCRGAMYPWESADTGEETTPRFVIGPNGKVIVVRNGEMELHITADVAYAIWQYWQATHDHEFLREAGAEIILETARMWATRGRMEEDGLYHIRHVIGPDEYHEDVDDSAFTNIMASWNMKRGVETAGILQQRWPEHWRELAGRLGINDDELASWSRLADAMYSGFDSTTKRFEQFRGYYGKEPIDLKSYEPRYTAMDVILGHERIQATNVVKQADVVMAMYLLWDQFSPDVREANFRYYEPRTGHGSSLSPSIHALLAARFGNTSLAEGYLRQAAEIDLGNNMGNAAGGVHAAAIGGLWQAVVFGFGGTQMHSDGLSFQPHLLSHWQRLAFPLQYRAARLHVSMDAASIAVNIEDGSGDLRIACDGHEIQARPRRRYVAERTNGGYQPWREA